MIYAIPATTPTTQGGPDNVSDIAPNPLAHYLPAPRHRLLCPSPQLLSMSGVKWEPSALTFPIALSKPSVAELAATNTTSEEVYIVGSQGNIFCDGTREDTDILGTIPWFFFCTGIVSIYGFVGFFFATREKGE